MLATFAGLVIGLVLVGSLIYLTDSLNRRQQ